MDIPWRKLQPQTLRALVEEYVTRDGTDYGVQEASFETKVSHVMRGLELGRVKVVFDAETDSCDLREVDNFSKFKEF